MAATMTERETGGEPEPEVVADEGRYLRRVRRWSIGVIAVVLVLAAFLGGRALLATKARSQVVMRVPAKPLTCAPLEDGSPGTTPGGKAIVAEGMRCELAFTVTNDGPMSVHVDSILLPTAGPASGAAVEAVELGPGTVPANRLEMIDEPGTKVFPTAAVDAVFDVDRTLDPHEVVHYRIELVHRPSGCAPKGMWITFGAPTAQVQALGQKGTSEATGTGGTFLSTTDLNEC